MFCGKCAGTLVRLRKKAEGWLDDVKTQRAGPVSGLGGKLGGGGAPPDSGSREGGGAPWIHPLLGRGASRGFRACRIEPGDSCGACGGRNLFDQSRRRRRSAAALQPLQGRRELPRAGGAPSRADRPWHRPLGRRRRPGRPGAAGAPARGAG
ncbi:hypothetical protein D3C71_1580420 [compost metagenome]